jgi:7,8-dihydropterin-6-yl-methyl-4-(beta-D-ribofuranosyl)aminobenzene 5'-phosphate synthase
MSSTEISILTENYVPTSYGLTAEAGLSIFIKHGDTSFLFDTGQSGFALNNAFIMGIDIKAVDKIILSHGHYDHVGGLEAFLKYLRRKTKIYLHKEAFISKYVDTGERKRYIGFFHPREYYENNLFADFNFVSEFHDFGGGIYSFCEIPVTNDFEKIPDALVAKKDGSFIKDDFKDDLSLAIDTDKGLLIILGCAHRGMVNICTEIKRKLSKKIYAIIGGTHIKDLDESKIGHVSKFIKDEGIKVFAPNHCTGIEKIHHFRVNYPDMFFNACCGAKLTI